MLEGLEISEIKLSELERTSRIDSEFYKKENLAIQFLLKNTKSLPLTEYVTVSDGNHMSISDNFSETGVPYDRGQDIHDFFIENANPICIPKSIFDLGTMQRSHLKKHDVLMSIVGTIGEISIVTTDANATCSCKLAILRPKKNVSAEVIALYLQSKYGQNQIRKFIRGAVQMGFILEDINQIFVPAFSKDFQSKIETLVKSAHAKLEKSKSLYAQAENLLLCELGMSGENLSEFSKPCGGANVSIKRFSDVFQSGRLDSEYYQKKYDLIEEKISHLETLKISEIGKLNDKNFSPEENAEYKYIELADIGTQGEISSCTLAKGSELPTRARRIVHKGDVLVSSIEGSLQSCAIVPSEFDGALCSTGFYVIEPKTMNAETLLILLKSENIQLLLKKGCSGTILTNISKEEFLKIRIPVLSTEIQSKIASLVRSSFSCRAESRQLLQNAKTLVEQEIEKQGEEIDEKKVAQINAVYDKVSEKEQISMSRSSMRSMWEAVKDDTW